jgi:uncharacterized protein Yka (UPF0111/DUF47 family)
MGHALAEQLHQAEGRGYALAEHLREVAQTIEDVSEAMVMGDMPPLLSEELWQLQHELHAMARELSPILGRLRDVAARIEVEDNPRHE